jgi:hypothetical protein
MSGLRKANLQSLSVWLPNASSAFGEFAHHETAAAFASLGLHDGFWSLA